MDTSYDWDGQKRRANTPAHGTADGYQKHWRERTQACDPCRVAHNAHKAERTKTPQGREARNKWRKSRRATQKAEIDAYKAEQGCQDCGADNLPAYCYDLDHRDQKTKVSGISEMLGKRSMDAIWAEAAKCDVVCVICHRIRTHEGQHYMTHCMKGASHGETP